MPPIKDREVLEKAEENFFCRNSIPVFKPIPGFKPLSPNLISARILQQPHQPDQELPESQDAVLRSERSIESIMEDAVKGVRSVIENQNAVAREWNTVTNVLVATNEYVAKLVTERTSLCKENVEAKHNLTKAENRLRVLEKEKDDTKKQNENLRQQLLDLQEANKDYKNSLTKAEITLKVREKFREQVLEKLQQDSQESKISLAKAEQRIDVLEKERDVIHNQNVALGRQVLGIRQMLNREREQKECVICQDKVKCVMISPCMHVCLCESCVPPPDCPMCRKKCQIAVKVYL